MKFENLNRFLNKYSWLYIIALTIIWGFSLWSTDLSNLIFYAICCLYLLGYLNALRLMHLKLRARDLTLWNLWRFKRNLRNYRFVKSWRQIRQTDLKQYCLKNGGMILGVALFAIVSFAAFWFIGLSFLLASFKNLFLVITASLVVSYALGAIIYFIRWRFNERLFEKLTNNALIS